VAGIRTVVVTSMPRVANLNRRGRFPPEGRIAGYGGNLRGHLGKEYELSPRTPPAAGCPGRRPRDARKVSDANALFASDPARTATDLAGIELPFRAAAPMIVRPSFTGTPSIPPAPCRQRAAMQERRPIPMLRCLRGAAPIVSAAARADRALRRSRQRPAHFPPPCPR